MTGTITPKTMDNREGFKMLGTEGEEGFGKGEGRVDNKMEGYKGNSGVFMKPLEVMLGPYLNRGRFCEGKVCGRTIEGAVKELVVRKIGLEGSKLSIRPPILLSGKGVDKVGGTGGERTLRKFRGDY